MTQTYQELNLLLSNLKERAKELNCLYEIETILQDKDLKLPMLFKKVCGAIPQGWQFSELCCSRVTFGGLVVTSQSFVKTKWTQASPLVVNEVVAGTIEVFYLREQFGVNRKIFLPEEQKLLNAICEKVGRYISYRKLEESVGSQEKSEELSHSDNSRDWKIVLELLQSTDLPLYLSISRKMMNHLCWIGIKKAKKLLGHFYEEGEYKQGAHHSNSPIAKKEINSIIKIGNDTFTIAEKTLSPQEITHKIKKWIKEDKISYLIRTLENQGSSLTDIQSAITRYYFQEKMELPEYITTNINVTAIYRLFTDQLEFISIAKNYLDITDFYNLIKNLVHAGDSCGKIGGKSAGIFLAQAIIKKNHSHPELKDWVKTPRSWYVTSDVMQRFLSYNNLMEVFDQKYKEIEQVKEEYPNIVQIFKNSHFPPEIAKGLYHVIESVGTKPIIVRSSSLLEDRVGAAFAGKYKSLFLANQGTKKERLFALKDAIAEIYASTFNTDPIEYRKERGFLDFREEMAIIIMEVVGKKVGKYFFPSFAGVAFSENHQRWSPRIKREDGLVRLVPGLGTRAVDRVSDDYPILIAPGKKDLRVNITMEEQIRYSPVKIDLINMETNQFETHNLKDILHECGEDYPEISNLISVKSGDSIVEKPHISMDFQTDNTIVTFNKLFSKTDFLPKIHSLLKLLQKKMGTPVDIEFAFDGDDFYLLQCRGQNNSVENSPAPIPQDLKKTSILFSAEKYIANGFLQDLSHIVYVNPDEYSNIETIEGLKTVGRIVGELNKILPKKKFILMGPGRWGSRGDIKLGVNVGYSDINNTCLLIEIARKKGNYTPDLSFGTHFFQDLVEASIKYLPLYPDETNVAFNEPFLTRSKNILADLLPQYKEFENVIRVIDVEEQTVDRTLNVAMNGELNQALAYFTPKNKGISQTNRGIKYATDYTDDHGDWRMNATLQMSTLCNYDAWGVVQLYIFGSTNNGNAGPSSDIDLLVHFRGDETQEKLVRQWFEGWSQSLSHANFRRTGYKTEGLLDLHFITDEDIKNKTTYAIMIGAVSNPAHPLPKK
jgi:pyruvate, water dikinase